MYVFKNISARDQTAVCEMCAVNIIVLSNHRCLACVIVARYVSQVGQISGRCRWGKWGGWGEWGHTWGRMEARRHSHVAGPGAGPSRTTHAPARSTL